MSNYSLGQIIANPFTYDNVTGKILIGISGPPTGVQSVDNEGNGHELVDNTDPANPKIKSIITGEGITMVNNGDDETISTNINYSAEDTNGKLNIFGLTSDFVSNTRLLVGQGTDTLDFQDDFGNKININEDKILIEQTNTSTDNTLARIAIANLPDKVNNPTFLDSVIEFKNNVLAIATQDVNSNQNKLLLEKSGITLLTNESVLIQPDVNFTTRVNYNPGVFTRTIQDGANISKEVVSISDNNTIMTMNYDTIFSASTSTGRSVETSLLNSPGDSYFRAKTVDQASPTLDRGELNVDLKGGYLYSYINNDINGVQVNGSQINITGDQINLIGLPNIPGYADTLVYNQITGQVAYKPVTTVDSLTLIGNPVHAFVNTTGNLNYRGMVSPDGSVNFNVTPTNIEITSPNQTVTLTGDVTGSGTGSFATTIANSAVSSAKIANAAVTSSKIGTSAVTYPKIQNVTASSLLGNPTGSAAAPSEITLGTNLSFAGSVLNATSGTSGVTSTNIQTFGTGSFTYTPTVGMQFCQVVAQGGGGGGGGCKAGAAGTSGASAGGSSGATVLGFYNAITIGASKSVVVGAGGAGGLGILGGAGSDGNNTTFGALITAAKGRGGAGSTASSSFTSTTYTSTFGTSSGGSAILEGSYGEAGHAHGNNLAPIAGSGGASTYFGDGGFGFGSGSGAGGGGVSTSGAVADVDGFAGKSGRLLVIEYI